MELYALWLPTEYALTYKNVTFSEGQILPQSYNIETDGVLPDPGARPGCEFAGWYLNSRCTIEFTGFEAGTRTGKLTLYAKWYGTPVKYAIGFDKGAEDATGTMRNMTGLVSGKDYTLTKNGFKRTGYTFTGWSLYEGMIGDRDIISDMSAYVPNYVENAPIVLTARWTPTAYKLTYKNLTAQELTEVPAAYDIENPAELPELTREGYDFGGWFTDSGFKKPVADDTVSGTGNRTLYAKWTAHKYTVVFDGNEAAKGSMKPLTVTYGTAKALTANSFARPGYTFLGWSEDPNATQATYKNQAKVLNLTPENGETVTLYAVWKAK